MRLDQVLSYALSLLGYGAPLSSLHGTSQAVQHHKLLSKNVSDYIDVTRRKYGINGVAVTVVKRPQDESKDWITDHGLYGTANPRGDPIAEGVSGSPSTCRFGN
jgi:hypothetical protein